jgi:hypothetical protein
VLVTSIEVIDEVVLDELEEGPYLHLIDRWVSCGEEHFILSVSDLPEPADTAHRKPHAASQASAQPGGSGTSEAGGTTRARH